ncbi:sulfite exporter TauE/SafE family protein [Mycobacterium sp. CVI_P3]|uniref:Probable membrane transporter protein n=1 Tax=Mycobacterium pinniadriaticum TaxID=2994102 RepID=A0ABT3SCA4_9MYCO|nr:sulfite exporter TauE/SafE family protein [Mycobacterium pinniadriaticum]MCX2930712.1 sulfite exporter TauE/SafE family protein [Mycobacterium pinniadriaticum]MCX2937136.1 sulfite exporter TauE/SafE family protein [Mycobacterium pinniadriaticum]
MTGVAIYLVYLLAGIVAGLVSGLFGLGGGLTIVPALAVALPLQGVAQEHVMHLAIGTSLAAMFFTALYTTFLRSRHGDMIWPLFWHMLPPVVLGTALGAFAGGLLPGPVLRVFFVGFVAYMLARALRRHYRQSRSSGASDKTAAGPVMPSRPSRLISGFTTGVTGALLGAGAAIITVPYLQAAGYRIQNASAIAAGLSAVIGIGAGAGYLLGGLGAAGLPAAAIGYLYLPAFAGMTAGALLGSPLGVRISHRMAETAQFWLFLTYLAVVMLAMVLPG